MNSFLFVILFFISLLRLLKFSFIVLCFCNTMTVLVKNEGGEGRETRDVTLFSLMTAVIIFHPRDHDENVWMFVLTLGLWQSLFDFFFSNLKTGHCFFQKGILQFHQTVNLISEIDFPQLSSIFDMFWSVPFSKQGWKVPHQFAMCFQLPVLTYICMCQVRLHACVGTGRHIDYPWFIGGLCWPVICILLTCNCS